MVVWRLVESWVFKPAGGSIQFWAPVSGTSTNLSDYPRTELREAYADGTPRNWKYTEGTATLTARMEVNQLPSVGAVIIGQIHGDGALKAVPFVMLRFAAAPDAAFDLQTFSGDIDNCFGPKPAETGYGPEEQHPSIGCSIKWRN